MKENVKKFLELFVRPKWTLNSLEEAAAILHEMVNDDCAINEEQKKHLMRFISRRYPKEPTIEISEGKFSKIRNKFLDSLLPVAMWLNTCH